MAKQDFTRTKSLDAAYMRKLRCASNYCVSNQFQVRGVWEMESMKASTRERVPSSGDRRDLICDTSKYKHI